ncbi:unnamed protein product [Spirodela intermedia]|uniref:Uncharacterized protein n=1 Tax=Spirodela intermedia TaxID=51605 RepID=A0A7I8J5K7_SPIIN|nr:unnamed protein product [Spirodela intermedia]CAA6665508.1 unnamed protein product [Spirodela intermedia]
MCRRSTVLYLNPANHRGMRGEGEERRVCGKRRREWARRRASDTYRDPHCQISPPAGQRMENVYRRFAYFEIQKMTVEAAPPRLGFSS